MGLQNGRTHYLRLYEESDDARNGNWFHLDEIIGNAFTPGNPIQLPLSGVVPGTYGDATHSTQLVVDATGRIVSILSVLISVSGASIAPNSITDAQIHDVSWSKVTGAPTSFPPTGPAGGDLNGSTYPNPVITGFAVTRGKLAANAPCGTPASTFIGTGYINSSSNTWTTIASLSITTRGGSVLLCAAPSLQGAVSSGSSGTVGVRWLNGALHLATSLHTLLGNGVYAAVPGFAWIDAPGGAATYTYALQGFADPNTILSTAGSGSLIGMEIG
jgi:hypothetical protein